MLDALTAAARRLSARVEQRLQRLEARHAAALSARSQALARTQEGLELRLARAGERLLDIRREAHRALGARFVRAGERTLARQGELLRRHEQALANLDPRRVLERGYTLLESSDGRALVSASALRPGEGVVAVLHDGRADLRVERVQADDDAAADKSAG